VAKGARAGFPQFAQCRTCHTADSKISLTEEVRIPARRVYRIPDYVLFSHARHAAAKVDCARCHGPVEARDVLTVEVEHTMKACVDCHKETKATIACAACHELGQ
jgi:hypothetical protein